MRKTATSTQNVTFSIDNGSAGFTKKLAIGLFVIVIWLLTIAIAFFTKSHETDATLCDNITQIFTSDPFVSQHGMSAISHDTRVEPNNDDTSNQNRNDKIEKEYIQSLLIEILSNITNNKNDNNNNKHNTSINLDEITNKLSLYLDNNMQSSSNANNNNNNNNENGFVNYRIPPIPSIIGIGPEKGGTTTLADLISFHPNLIDEFVKPQQEPSGVTWEMRMFMKCGGNDIDKTLAIVSNPGSPAIGENKCSLGWYQHHWPIMYNDIRYKNILQANWQYLEYLDSKSLSKDEKSGLNENPTLARYYSNYFNKYVKNWKFYYYFEKSPAYWYHEHIASIFGQFLVPQGTRFYIQLRNPTSRLFSYYNHQSQLRRLKNGMSFKSYMLECYEKVDKGIMKTIISKLKETDKPLFSIESKERAFLTNHALDIINLWKNHVYSDFSNVYDSKKLGNHPKTGRLTGDDVTPWKGLGGSCYIVPMLMWLKHIPVEHMTIVQSESIFGDQTQFVYDFRCWVANGYEFFGNIKENCPKYRAKTKMPDQKLVSSARGKKASADDSQWANNNVFSICNTRLKEFINFRDNKKILLNGKFDWDKWN